MLYDFEIGFISLAAASGLWLLGRATAQSGSESRTRRSIATGIKGLAGVFGAVGLFFLWAEYQGDSAVAESTRCRENLKHLAEAVLLYAQDWDDHLPPSARWATCIDTHKYLSGADPSTVFHCPTASTRYGYAMNSALSGIAEDSIDRPADTVLLFETDSSAFNAHGSITDMARPRHLDLNVAFCDGSTHWVNQYRRDHWTWSPAPESRGDTAPASTQPIGHPRH